ncbi:MAG: AAA family ATPase [Parvibaculum sp.]
MRYEGSNFFVITGGPGAGKTTLVEALSAQGLRCVEEAGRQILREQARIGGNATHDGDRIAYRELMLSRSIFGYEQAMEQKRPVLFDRGIPDLIGYSHLIGADVPAYLENAVALYRYNRHVFMAPPWEDIYVHDAERRQDFREAVATHDAIRRAYQEAGYEPVELPKASVEARVDHVLATLRGL